MTCKMPKKRQYSKEAIDNAVKFVNDNFGSIRGAAKQFGVPRSSIQFKLRNPTSKFKSGPDPVLNEAEENELCNFILQLAKRGFPRKKDDIKTCVEDFLKVNPRPNPFRNGKPGDVWFKAFLNRHPNISIRTSEEVTNASACVSEQDIRKWFQEIKQYFDEESLLEVIGDPTRVCNADETGFNVCPKTGKILAQKGCKNVYEVEKSSAKENITVLFTFSAAGVVCDPLIIYPFKRIPDRVTLSVPSGWGIGRSDTGWMTAAVFCEYIANCFYQQLLTNNITLPVILFVDGHKTHLTIEVSELCRSLQIHLIALYPNATRILQPADVAAFRPIKVGWKKALREWHAANNYQASLTKEHFAPLLKTVVESCAKKDTLINGFRICGLYPFDPDNVDYSKCIALTSRKEPEHGSISSLSVTNACVADSCVLTYSDFCEIVGKPIVEKCLTANTISLQESDDNFKAIYKLWQKLHGSREYNNNDLETPISGKETTTTNYIRSSNINESNTPRKEKEICSILDATTGEFIYHTSIKDGGSDEANENIVTEENEDFRELQIPTSSTKTNNEQPYSSNQMCPTKKIDIISNVLLSDYLKTKKLPDPPKRQGKRQTEKTPFALTSNCYLEIIKAKQRKKQEEEAAKEERKRLREENKAQKKENVPKKKPKKDVKKKDDAEKPKILENKETGKRAENQPKTAIKSAICCDSCLSPITRKVIECSECCKKYHFNCIPLRHRLHIPKDDDDDFLCHSCYRESNTDSSYDDDNHLFKSLSKEARKQGF